jgi:hypothetical protein
MLNPQHNLNQVKRLFEEVFTNGDLSVCHELMSDNIKFHDPAIGYNMMGLQTFKDLVNPHQYNLDQAGSYVLPVQGCFKL